MFKMSYQSEGDSLKWSGHNRSWRTLAEIPTDKVACAIFIQETLTSMIQQKLIKTPEEADNALEKLCEMMGCLDDNADSVECSDETSGCCGNRTCGKVCAVERLHKGMSEGCCVNVLSCKDKCCGCAQQPLHLQSCSRLCPSNYLHHTTSDFINHSSTTEEHSSPVLIRLARAPQCMHENHSNISNPTQCTYSCPQKNYLYVVEDNVIGEDFCKSRRRRSRKSKKDRNCSKKFSTTVLGGGEKKKGLIECDNELSLERIRGLLRKRQSTRPPEAVGVCHTWLSWASPFYYFLLALLHFSKTMYHRIV